MKTHRIGDLIRENADDGENDRPKAESMLRKGNKRLIQHQFVLGGCSVCRHTHLFDTESYVFETMVL